MRPFSIRTGKILPPLQALRSGSGSNSTVAWSSGAGSLLGGRSVFGVAVAGLYPPAGCFLPSHCPRLRWFLSKSPGRIHSSSSSTTSKDVPFVRLSRRMAELDLCSRREADRLIAMGGGAVVVRGIPIEPILGQKVRADECDIRIVGDVDGSKELLGKRIITNTNTTATTVVLHKPRGFVSGQPDAALEQVPAVRLLTRRRMWQLPNEKNVNVNVNDVLWESLPKTNTHQRRPNPRKQTLRGYVPAGRLDRESTGLLVLTRSGVVAKKLVGPNSHGTLEKEYVVEVAAPLVQSGNRHGGGSSGGDKVPNVDATVIDDNGLDRNLSILYRSDNVLRGDHRPLRPVVVAERIEPRTISTSTTNTTVMLRIVLTEGRKHQIRRMCDELLGLRVVSLHRVRVGPLRLDGLPEGRWRIITDQEARALLGMGVSSSEP